MITEEFGRTYPSETNFLQFTMRRATWKIISIMRIGKFFHEGPNGVVIYGGQTLYQADGHVLTPSIEFPISREAFLQMLFTPSFILASIVFRRPK